MTIKRNLAVLTLSALAGFSATGIVLQQVEGRANAGSGGYLLSNIDIEYPYSGDPRDETANEDEAGIRYNAEWVGESYPGSAECSIELFGRDGKSVGALPLSISHLTPTAVSARISVDVTGAPERAEAQCQPAVYESGEGYVFSALKRVDAYPAFNGEESTWVDLVFDARWKGTVEPGARVCYATVSYEDGSSEMLPEVNFESSMPTAEVSFRMDKPKGPAIKGASVSCDEFRG